MKTIRYIIIHKYKLNLIKNIFKQNKSDLINYNIFKNCILKYDKLHYFIFIYLFE